MRLINVHTMELEDFSDRPNPEYVILSHTWEDEEVSHRDWQAPGHSSHLRGFRKITEFCRLAREEYNVSYAWCDTNCIDKTSSSELTETINSMYKYYKQAKCCLVYLADVLGDFSAAHKTPLPSPDLLGAVKRSRWLTRGWCLQELIAPQKLAFYGCAWTRLDHLEQGELFCSGASPCGLLWEIAQWTGVDYQILTKQKEPFQYSTAARLSWASGRSTTRVEDEAYCLLGIFKVNMPLIYGEGRKAFLRLQEEIVKTKTDHSVLAWGAHIIQPLDESHGVTSPGTSVLAPSPVVFAQGQYGEIVECYHNSGSWVQPYEINNFALRLSAPCIPCTSNSGWWHVVLNCRFKGNNKGPIALTVEEPEQMTVPDLVKPGHSVPRVFFVLELEHAQKGCNATHLGRLAVVLEEHLLTVPQVTTLILRHAQHQRIQKMRRSEVSQYKRCFERRIRMVFHSDKTIEHYPTYVVRWPSQEWLPDENIWIQQSSQAVFALSTPNLDSNIIAFLMRPFHISHGYRYHHHQVR